MENLKALVSGKELSLYQRRLAVNEFEKLLKDQQEMFSNMQYYMEYCESNGYVTPMEWLEKYKHF